MYVCMYVFMYQKASKMVGTSANLRKGGVFRCVYMCACMYVLCTKSFQDGWHISQFEKKGDACMYTCMYIRMRVYVRRERERERGRERENVCVCVCKLLYAFLFSLFVFAYLHIRVYKYVYMYVCKEVNLLHTCVYASMCICMYAKTYVYACAEVHSFCMHLCVLYTYICTCTHTYMHTRISRQL